MKKIVVLGLLCLLCLTGCGKKELLKEKLDASQIDKVVVTMAMGNPAYGAECKVITDAETVQEFVFLFNNAEVDEKIDSGEEWVADSGSYVFFSGEEQVAKFNVNGNDPERIRRICLTLMACTASPMRKSSLWMKTGRKWSALRHKKRPRE